MRVFIDTNILISSVLVRGSIPAVALLKASSFLNTGIVSEQNIDEMISVFHRKFPSRIPDMENFLLWAMFSLEIVPSPNELREEEKLIRDVKDRPILRAAIMAGSDILLTGDKDFLESGITNPRIMSASEFLKLEQ